MSPLLLEIWGQYIGLNRKYTPFFTFRYNKCPSRYLYTYYLNSTEPKKLKSVFNKRISFIIKSMLKISLYLTKCLFTHRFNSADYVYKDYKQKTFSTEYQKQSGAVEACWAHNPEVRRSKLRSAKVLLTWCEIRCLVMKEDLLFDILIYCLAASQNFSSSIMLSGWPSGLRRQTQGSLLAL